MRTFLKGDDCNGGLDAQNDNFLFLLGVRVESGSCCLDSSSSGLLGVLGNAGPKRFSTGVVISDSGLRTERPFLLVLDAFNEERGVKNLLNDLGVIGGCFFGFSAGGEEGSAGSEERGGGEDGTVSGAITAIGVLQKAIGGRRHGIYKMQLERYLWIVTAMPDARIDICSR